MAVFLKAILAICLLVEIVSTNPLRQPEQFKIEDQKFKRYVSNLNASLNPACREFKNSGCSEKTVRIIKFEYNDEQMCQTYSRVFLDVYCVLDEFAKNNPTECNDTVSEIQPHPKLYDKQTNCTLPNDDEMLMKDFCPKLQDYVNHLIVKNCVKS